MGYPDFDAECQMLINRSTGNPLDSVEQIVSKEELTEMQQAVKSVYVHKNMARYIVSLINATRNSKFLSRGASPRATLSLTDMTKAIAFAEDRDYVVPRDVQNVFVSTLNHRIILSNEAMSQNLSAEEVLTNILKHTKQPKL